MNFYNCSPSVAALARKAIWLSPWGSLVGIVEVVRGHDARLSVIVRHHEGREDLKFPGVFKGDHVTTASVTALIVVVVDENERRHRTHVTPGRANRLFD